MPIRIILILLAIAAALAGGPARAAEPVGEADRAAIRQVVEDQLAAFRRDDGTAAFGLASPFIQEKFGSADNFMAMVRTGYAAVYRPRQVEFREIADDPSLGLVQKVLLVGPDGHPVLAIYQMQKQPDGRWKINGCILTQSPDIGV
jgi:ketosteroid isomerase-like protein